jgi:hypothetical protein
MKKEKMLEHMEELHYRIEELEGQVFEDSQRLLNIWNLHTENLGTCTDCEYEYPCPTIKAFYLCDCCP